MLIREDSANSFFTHRGNLRCLHFGAEQSVKER